MDKKPTDSEIIKALECCIKSDSRDDCMKCPLGKLFYQECSRDLMKDALDLINRQQAENERLKKQLNNAEDLVCEKTCKITDLNGDIEILQKQFDELSRVARVLHEENVSKKAEVERLKGWQDLLKAEKHSLIKTEAYKEFAEKAVEKVEKARQKYQRLCKEQGEEMEEHMHIHFNGIIRIINNLLKELVENENEKI